MALHFKCFFCNRIIPVYRENESKFVSCPDCGAQINVSPDMAISPTEAKGCSCGGCLAFLIVIGLVGGFIFTIFAHQKASPQQTRQARPSNSKTSSLKYYRPDRAFAEKFIYRVVTQALSKISTQHQRTLFEIPASWKNDPQNLNAGLRQVYQRQQQKYKSYQKQLPAKLTVEIWRSLQAYKFSNKSDFSNKVILRCQRILESQQGSAVRFRYPNINTLAYYLRTHLFENANLPPDSSLQDAILRSDRFSAYDTLFIPTATTALYWDWSIGVHYCFTKRKVKDIRPTNIGLLAWEKIPFYHKKKQCHYVIVNNGKVQMWTARKLTNELRRK